MEPPFFPQKIVESRKTFPSALPSRRKVFSFIQKRSFWFLFEKRMVALNIRNRRKSILDLLIGCSCAWDENENDSFLSFWIKPVTNQPGLRWKDRLSRISSRPNQSFGFCLRLPFCLCTWTGYKNLICTANANLPSKQEKHSPPPSHLAAKYSVSFKKEALDWICLWKKGW